MTGLTASIAVACGTGGGSVGGNHLRAVTDAEVTAGDAAPPTDALPPRPDLPLAPVSDGARPGPDAAADVGPIPDDAVVTPDAATVPPDGAVVTPDAARPLPDAVPLPPDAASLPVDAAPPPSDGPWISVDAVPPPPDGPLVSLPDMAPAQVDAAVPVIDAAVPVIDAAVPVIDAAVPVIDAAVPVIDAAVRVIDAAVPIIDAAVPVIDAAVPIIDAALPVDAPVPVVDAAPPPPPPPPPAITEFMAFNAHSLTDDDGDHSDWIEIFNPGADPLPVAGYALSDDPLTPEKWLFPDAEIPAYGYLVVFASGKDRVSPDGTLHTNFKLNGDGESLLLSDADGALLQQIDFPMQFEDASFGVRQTAQTTVLFDAGEPLRYTAALPDPAFIDPDFDDSAWAEGAAGVGFDNVLPPPGPVALADSMRDYSGVQGQAGQAGWRYGYYDKTNDPNGVYDAAADFRAFPAAGGGWSPANFWSGTAWDWTPGDPPWTQVSQEGGHPSGRNNGAWHWSVRRFTSPVAGPVHISGMTGKDSSAGDGTACHIFVDGVEVFVRRFDVTRLRRYGVDVTLGVGSTVDFAIDPGFDGNDSSDTTTFTARLEVTGGLDDFGPVLADSIDDWHEGGLQGQNGWFYGTRRAGGDFRAYPNDWTTLSATDQWDGTQFTAFPNGGAWASVGQKKVTPGGGYWPTKRWLCTTAGDLRLRWRMWKFTTTGTGVTGRVFVNGVQVDAASIAAADRIGVDRYTSLPDMHPGDLVDVAVDPTGPGGQADETGDTTSLDLVISRLAQPGAGLGTPLADNPATLYTRLHFQVPDPALFNRLVLSAKFDDGLYAWLSGAPEVAANVAWPAAPAAQALTDRSAMAAVAEQPLTMDAALLSAGDNVVAAQIVNGPTFDGRLVYSPRVLGRFVSLNTDVDGHPAPAEPLPAPTPGADNLYDGLDSPPHVRVINQFPAAEPGQPVTVQAQVVSGTAPLNAVTLIYRQMFGVEAEVPMVDIGGGLYQADIPAAASVRGQMVRFSVRVVDAHLRTVRAPEFKDGLDSEHYYGTVPTDARIATAIPVLHWFLQNPASAGTAAGTRGVVFYGGEMYDNVYVNIHGQSTQGFNKKSFNFDLNADHRLKLTPNVARVKDFNLLTNWADKAKMRNTLAWEVYRDAASDHHLAFPVHVRQNGEFYALYEIVEDGDDRMLERNGRDPNGALYKMYDGLVDTTRGEKKTRKDEGKADLQALISNLQLQGDAKRLWIYDNVNLGAMANFLAAMFITASTDCCHKNYYAYRDTNGTGEWWYIIWDLDLSFGHNWTPQFNYFDDTIYVQNRLFIGANNALTGALFAIPDFNAMYVRRVRSLVDRMVQPPETPPELLHFENRVAIQVGLIKPDADLDYARWGSWNVAQTFDQGVARLVNEFLGPRRAWIYNTLTERAVPPGPLPAAQGDLTVRIAEIEPAAAPTEAYVVLENTGDAAVDISAFSLTGGGIDRRIEPGTVIPAHGRLYVVADARGFRARQAGPHGGQGLFVQGNWTGALDPALAGELELLDEVGGHVAP